MYRSSGLFYHCALAPARAWGCDQYQLQTFNCPRKHGEWRLGAPYIMRHHDDSRKGSNMIIPWGVPVSPVLYNDIL